MKPMKAGCDLKTCMLCRLGVKDWIPAVGAHRKNYSLKKGEVLFEEGNTVNGIYFIFTGIVKVHKRWGEDKQLIVRFAKAGEIVGHRGLGKENEYPVSATALENTTVCFIEQDFFQSSLRVNTELLYQLMLFYAAELQESEKNMRNLAHMPVKNRIARALLSLQEKFGTHPDGHLNVSLSKQDLSSYVGTSYETFFRLLGELAAEGVIRVQDRNITLLNLSILQQMSEGKASFLQP